MKLFSFESYSQITCVWASFWKRGFRTHLVSLLPFIKIFCNHLKASPLLCREPASALGKRIASAVAEVLAEATKEGEGTRTKQHRFWKKSDEPTQRFDFVVVGSGVAGLKYALSVAEHGSVAVVTKSAARESNTNYAQVC